MSRRAVLGVAATVVALATAAPATPATAATPQHVAIVVSGIGTACIPWHSGMTGADVLNGGYTVVWGQRSPYVGFVLQINGVGTTHPDDSHYWAYFHNDGSGWAYSSTGAASYKPKPGTVEGWSYVDGQPKPTTPSGTYAEICAGADPQPSSTAPATSAPAATSTAATARPHTSTASRSSGGTASSSATSPSTAPAGSTAASSGPATVTATRAGGSASPSGSASGSGVLAASGTATTPGTSAAAGPTRIAALPSKKAESSPPWASVLALLAVAAVAGAAVWQTRRRRGSA